MSTSAPPDPILEQLKQYTPCDVSTALVKLQHRHGGFLPGLTLWSPERQAGATRVAGPAYTVQYAPLADPAPALAARHYVDAVPAGAVMLVASPAGGTPRCALYGGLATARARARGAAACVVDGRLRDLQEHRAMGFPVFARGVATAPPAARVKVVATGVPIRLAAPVVVDGHDDGAPAEDMEVRPGDYLVGDLNGVVVLPRELAERALPLIKASVEADDQMMVAIRNGMSFEEASKKFRG